MMRFGRLYGELIATGGFICWVNGFTWIVEMFNRLEFGFFWMGEWRRRSCRENLRMRIFFLYRLAIVALFAPNSPISGMYLSPPLAVM